MRHRIKASMHHFIVHRKDEHVMEEPQHQVLQPLPILAIDVPFLARGRRVHLGLNGWRSDDENAMIGKRTRNVGDKALRRPGSDGRVARATSRDCTAR